MSEERTPDATWNGFGWRPKPTGKFVRINKGVRPYGGRKVELVEVNEIAKTVDVYIQPAVRMYLMSEVTFL